MKNVACQLLPWHFLSVKKRKKIADWIWLPLLKKEYLISRYRAWTGNVLTLGLLDAYRKVG